ncbi:MULTISPECIES: benzoate 1,2-dioxygenase electron transfer component BenC [unclassified Rhodococcus (in: high G+C Gram-positive bacteria)]|uniref:benzoate 1,2-dioxygenase electron transfer component BenC n=1 Tax=unclassified Rhodococcus (in: high G+C Gram-positive bacteria) TaxID=192944 RepID=UPI00096A5639|nr:MULTISPECIES: benzoate 1,2-dioxygenase electron transfer component BenC [unclassified Rhodococcus (in: high G+C Gram-positive bacteria)]
MSIQAAPTFQVALSFEDGITRFVECNTDETVADASYRARINIPLDCRDGACGTCKSLCESGTFDAGDYIEEALTDDEAEQGYCLPCQMVPESDLVLQIPTTSAVAKTTAGSYTSTVTEIIRHSDSTVGFTVAVDNRADLVFLPGQYVNILVPGTEATRSYSFSSGPEVASASFLVKITPGGLMSEYLSQRAQVGDTLELTGPMGSFFLRSGQRRALLLAGGTGLAPLLSILEKMRTESSTRPVHLVYGVSSDTDLVELDKLHDYAESLPQFTFDYCVSDPDSTAPNKGYVTGLIEPDHLDDGNVDVYLCGPPPMVEAVRLHFKDVSITPTNFYFEKFNNAAAPADSPAASAEESAAGTYEIGEEHLPVTESDAQFDARMALELGAMELTIGRLTPAQLTEYRILAENSAASIDRDHFTDAAAFTETNALFHDFLFRCTGNEVLLQAYHRLEVTQLMNRVLRTADWVDEHVAEDHSRIVSAFEQNDRTAARDLIVQHSEHAKSTMHRAITDARESVAS